MVMKKKVKGLPKAVLSISDLATKDKVAAVQAITSTAASSPVLKASPALQQAQKTLVAAHDAVEASLGTHDGAKKAQSAAEEDLRQKEAALVAAANAYRDIVNATPTLDEPAIAGLGLKVAGARGASPAMTPPQGVTTKLGQQPGAVSVSWTPVKGAKTYLVQTTEDPAAATGWVEAAAVTKAKVALEGLTSGKRTWVRVATVGPSGTSPFGEPVSARVA
jgi:hypothetical protein